MINNFETVAGDFQEDGWTVLRPTGRLRDNLRHVGMAVEATEPVLHEANRLAGRVAWRESSGTWPWDEEVWKREGNPWRSDKSEGPGAALRLAHVLARDGGFSRFDATTMLPLEAPTFHSGHKGYLTEEVADEARRRVVGAGKIFLDVIGCEQPEPLDDTSTGIDGFYYPGLKGRTAPRTEVNYGEASVTHYTPDGRLVAHDSITGKTGHRDRFRNGIIASMQTTDKPTTWMLGSEEDPVQVVQRKYDLVVLNSDPDCGNQNPYHDPQPRGQDRMSFLYVALGEHEKSVRNQLGLPAASGKIERKFFR